MYSGELRPLSDHLMDIVQKLQISKEDRESYTSDAQDIQNAIMEGIKKRDTHFKEAFRGLSLTGSYLDDVKLHAPDEFDMHIKLEFPFELSVEEATKLLKKRSKKIPGFVFIRGKTNENYPIFNPDGYLNRVLLQEWMRINFKAVITQIGEVCCRTGHTYQLDYTLPGYACAHTISATDKNNSSRKIWFDFVPAFEFDASKFPSSSRDPNLKDSFWFAVPQKYNPNDNRSFMICAPHFEKNVTKNKHKLKDALRLMKALRDANNMPHLTSYMLKTVFLHAVDEKHEGFWQRPISVIFTKMLGRLLNDMNRKRLEFFLAPGLNHLDRLNKKEIKQFRQTIDDLLMRLKSLKAYGRPVAYEQVAELFNLA